MTLVRKPVPAPLCRNQYFQLARARNLREGVEPTDEQGAGRLRVAQTTLEFDSGALPTVVVGTHLQSTDGMVAPQHVQLSLVFSKSSRDDLQSQRIRPGLEAIMLGQCVIAGKCAEARQVVLPSHAGLPQRDDRAGGRVHTPSQAAPPEGRPHSLVPTQPNNSSIGLQGEQLRTWTQPRDRILSYHHRLSRA